MGGGIFLCCFMKTFFGLRVCHRKQTGGSWAGTYIQVLELSSVVGFELSVWGIPSSQRENWHPSKVDIGNRGTKINFFLTSRVSHAKCLSNFTKKGKGKHQNLSK